MIPLKLPHLARVLFAVLLSTLLISLASCSREPGLDLEKVKAIELGMSTEEISQRLGKPTKKYRLRGIHAWEYTRDDGFAVVSFDQEKVKAVSLNGEFIKHVEMVDQE